MGFARIPDSDEEVVLHPEDATVVQEVVVQEAVVQEAEDQEAEDQEAEDQEAEDREDQVHEVVAPAQVAVEATANAEAGQIASLPEFARAVQ